jgi:hypothetical protein
LGKLYFFVAAQMSLFIEEIYNKEWSEKVKEDAVGTKIA